MEADNISSRFPNVDKALFNLENSKNLATKIAWTFVAFGATIYDFPGALKKASKDFKVRSKQLSYRP